jgi:predicted PurR-regulated permease PerM
MAPRTPAKPEAEAAPSRVRLLLRLVALLALITAMLVGAYYLSDVFAPLIAALVLAYMLDPLVGRLEKRGWSRGKAVAVIFIVALLSIGALVGVMVPFAVRDVGGAVVALTGEFDDANWNGRLDPEEAGTYRDRTGDGVADPGYIVKIDLWMRQSTHLKAVAKWIEAQHLKERLIEWARTNAREIAEQSFSVGSAGMQAVVGAIGYVIWVCLTIVLFPIYLFVFMKGLGGIREKAVATVPGPWRAKFELVFGELGTCLSAFFQGRLVIAVATAIVTAAGFGILGLRFGVILGVAIGLATIVPFLNLAFLVPALAIAALESPGASGVLWVLAVYGIGQAIDPILSPYVLSKGTGLHPVTVFVSILVWGRLLGLVGMLLSVPLTAACKILGRELVLPLLASFDAHAPAESGDA